MASSGASIEFLCFCLFTVVLSVCKFGLNALVCPPKLIRSIYSNSCIQPVISSVNRDQQVVIMVQENFSEDSILELADRLYKEKKAKGKLLIRSVH